MLPGFAVSALGDGIATVAVSWLGIELAPSESRGVWVALAVSAYTLPSVIGALLLGRFLRHRDPAKLVILSALLRAGALGLIPVLYLAGALNIGLYVTLLASSSVLHSWGRAGVYTLVARALPRENHVAGNAVRSLIISFSTIVGPIIASGLIAWGGAALAVAIDAATFAVLAFSFLLLVPMPPDSVESDRGDPGSKAGGFQFILGSAPLLGLLVLSFLYFTLFGPVYVALPLHISENLHAEAGTLAAFYTSFSVGAMLGATATGYLGRFRLWPTTIGVVIAFGCAMLPLGLDLPITVAMMSFAVAGLLWPPYSALSIALFQRSVPEPLLSQTLAANSSVRTMAVPLGTAAGGLLVSVIGSASTLQFLAGAMIVLGLLSATIVLLRTRKV